MKANKYFLNTALAAVLGIALLAAVLCRTFFPAVIIPTLNIPNMVLLSLAALLLDHYLAKNSRRCYICIPLLALAAFGVLPFAACFVGIADAIHLALGGSMVFTATTWLFSSMQDRLSSGPAQKAAPILSALCLYLAAQCFAGVVL